MSLAIVPDPGSPLPGRIWRSSRAPRPSFPTTSGSLRAGLEQLGARVFADALADAGLLQRLTGPFTLFAPSDRCFAELAATLREHPSALHRVLGYHTVLEGCFTRDALLERDFLEPAIGQRLFLEFDLDDALLIDGARLEGPQLRVGEGVIHRLERPLLPAELDLLELLHLSDNFDRMIDACELLGLEPLLRGSLPYTLLVPRGLMTMPTWRWHALLREDGLRSLRGLIRRHIVAGRVYLDRTLDKLRNLEGQALAIGERDGVLTIAGREVLLADVEARNGLVHVVDGQLG